jgi:hypothetical protein
VSWGQISVTLAGKSTSLGKGQEWESPRGDPFIKPLVHVTMLFHSTKVLCKSLFPASVKSALPSSNVPLVQFLKMLEVLPEA